MGIGASPAGAGPAGADLAASTDQRFAATPAALAFDGQTKDFSLDTNGRYVAAHPIDTKVFHRLRILAGSMRSAPATGNGIGGKWIDAKTIEATIRDQIRVTLEDMITAREIEDRGLVIDLSVRGRVALEYSYFNVRSGRPGSFRSTL